MSATEDGITDLMADYLRKNGVSAVTQISFSTPTSRSQPDFQIENGGTFLGEAKWEDQKWEGFGEARDYGQLAGISGSFLITYPNELREEASQARLGQNTAEAVLSGHEFTCAFLRRDAPTDMATLELEDIPVWITSNIKERRQPEPDPDAVVDVLRQTAYILNDELEAAPDENLFRNVLGAEPEEEDERQAARRTAGFLLVNQITFYRVLSSKKEFPEIDPDQIGVPEDLGEYFELVLEVDYTPVFSFRIAEELPQESVSVLRDTIKTIYALSPENINHDILGKVFHDLIPVSARRQVAAYYTKNQSAEILAGLSIDDANAKVMDPACGSGSLLASAYMRKRELSVGFDEETHRRFVEEDLTGIDVMPFAAHLSCIHLALQAPVYETDEINIGIEDSTKLEPGSTISPLSFVLPEASEQRALTEFQSDSGPDISDETVESGSIAMDAAEGQQMTLDTVDVVIMNPPFTRQESVAGFADGYKDRLRNRFSRRDSKGQIHGKMNYCDYFMFLADKFLDEGGRIATVLPANILAKSTDSGVREMLVDEYTIEYIFTREDELYFSEDTGIREIMLIAKKGTEQEARTTYVSLDGLKVNSNDIRSASEELTAGSQGETRTVPGEDGDSATVWQIPESQVDTHNLFSPFAVRNRDLIQAWSIILDAYDHKLTTVEDLDAGLTRGGSSHPWTNGCIGAPDAELRKSDVWRVRSEDGDQIVVEHRHIGEEMSIPRQAVESYLLRKQYRKKLDVTEVPEYTVVREFDGIERFLSLAEEEHIPDGWEDHVAENAAHMAIPETAYLTAPGTSHPVFYSDRPRIYHRMWMFTNLDPTTSKILSLWFDSSIGILQFMLTRLPGRGGWTKYRKYTQQRFVCPNVDDLTENEIVKLISFFEDIATKESPSLVEQMALNTPQGSVGHDTQRHIEKHFEGITDLFGEGYEPRIELDKIILEILGVPDDHRDEFLDSIYEDLLIELTELKNIVDG